jgi:molybdenum cofactor cytidylyltransferase
MGTLKPLLPYGSGNVIQSVVRSLKACPVERVIVVLGHRGDEIAASLEGWGAELVVNANYQAGMLSSLQAGLAAVPPDTEWLVIALGDQPSVRPDVVRLLLTEGTKGPATILVPSFGNRRGHPLLIHARHRSEVLSLNPEVGLRELLLRHPDAVRHVPVADDAVLHDMDTPEDYERELARLADAPQEPSES